MKLEERPSTQQAEDELVLDLSELRVAIDRESPSSFNKSMDFARHTKKVSARTPPSRNCSKDSMDSFLGDSFMGDDSFAVHEDHHNNNVALDDLECHPQAPPPPPPSISFNKSMDLARHSPTKRSASSRVMPRRAHSKDHDGILGASCTSTSIMSESFLMEDSFANASFAYGDNDHADDSHLQSSPVKRSERPDLETVLDLEENECLVVLDLDDDDDEDDSSGKE